MRKAPTPSVLANWRRAADENGQRNISLRLLLKAFGYQRRSLDGLAAIKGYLEARELFVDIAHGMDIDASVALTPEPIRRIGDLYAREKELEAQFVGRILRRVGLSRVVRKQYSPRRTRDKLDFLCTDSAGCSVVVELKARAGDKRAVEQVLRYIGMLKDEGGHKDPRGILITGIADMNTRRALEGREVDDHIRWWIYGLRGPKLLLEEVDLRRARTTKPTGGTGATKAPHAKPRNTRMVRR